MMDALNFSRQLDLLPGYLGAHIMISLSALLAGIILSIPTSLRAVRTVWWRNLAVSVASIVQTIPGLALLALMVPLLGRIGFLPAFIALVFYSILPVLRNTIAGIVAVDRSVLEAARGIGMDSRQILWHIEIPLALPVMIAGIRTSAVWVVGTATLATPVGATSLGNYIFSGLQTRNFLSVTFGCVAAALLALFLDQVIRLFEAAARSRSRRQLSAAVIGLLLLIGGVIPSIGSSERTARRVVTIGSKPFTEQYILAEAIGARLVDGGYEVTLKSGLGSTILFEALASGDVDCYIDYSGTVWSTNMKREQLFSRAEILSGIDDWLWKEKKITLAGPIGFENRYSLAMSRARANRNGISALSDLAPFSSHLRFGSDYEFLVRPEWEKIRTVYGLEFAEVITFDPSLMYEAVSVGEVDVISAYSTDGRITAGELRILEDDREVLPPYDAILLVAPGVAGEEPFRSIINQFVGAISSETMRRANEMVDVRGLSVDEAARFLLSVVEERQASGKTDSLSD